MEIINCPKCKEKGFTKRLPISYLRGECEVWCKHCKQTVKIKK